MADPSQEIQLIFTGTGTSQGIPVIACLCDVCHSNNPKDKRLRTSAVIKTQGVTISIDAGPDFRQQMLRANITTLDAVIFTHEHKDHVAGLDDVRAYNYHSQKPMKIFCTNQVYKGLCREFHYVFDPMFDYPGIPQIETTLIDLEPFEVDGIKIIPIRGWHYKLPVTAFRVGDLTYVTDVNRFDQEELEKIKGSKTLVINALRKEEHISHFTLNEALELIKEIGPEEAYLTHLSHQMGLHDEVSKELPDNVHIAYDGLEITI